VIRLVDASCEDVFELLKKRTVTRDAATELVVAEIIEDVRRRGDVALLENARRYDAPDLPSIVVTPEEIETALVASNHAAALGTAVERVTAFHRAQLEAVTRGLRRGERGWFWPDLPESVEGTFLGQRISAIAAAGVYVPGGNATYPSSVIMNTVPAAVAGVGEIAVTTPARLDGSLDPAVLVALRLVGVRRVYKVGGAAAIAALALGTESIGRVDKIVGPGNRYVNEAKRQLWGQVGVDGYAGPSEVCVLADDTANAAFAAADLLTQIEHAPDNAAFLITLSTAKMDEILAEVQAQIGLAPRAATLLQALATESLAVVAKDLDQAIEIVNAIAPEHLTLAIREPEKELGRIRNAGCLLLGEFTPESAGDFVLGPSHTLPTSGAARFGGPVNVLDFLKVQSIARMTSADLAPLIPVIEAFGEMEGFPTHAAGASIRLGMREA
jgi:histidinol dehydrogenase